MPPLPGLLPATTSNTAADRRVEIINLPAGHAYSHTSIQCAESFTIDPSAQQSKHVSHFDPDMLPDKATSTG
jgi:hypothetical protein